jgi:stress response protein YsnF
VEDETWLRPLHSGPISDYQDRRSIPPWTDNACPARNIMESPAFFLGKQAVTMSDQDDQKIQLVEESVSVEKERVLTGRVRVSTSSTEVEELAQATLAGKRVEVTRVRIEREIDALPETRVEGDTTIIPVVEEIMVIEKRLVLVEEIRIRQIVTSEDVSVPVTLRKQTGTVERIDE